MKRQKVTLPDHAARMRIITAPMPVTRVISGGRAWGGTFIRDSVPTEGRRVWRATPEDEEWCKSRWEEK